MGKLSDAEVVRLRERFAAGARQVELAREFGVAQTAVSAIVNGRTRAGAGGPIAAPRAARPATARVTSTPRRTLTDEHVQEVRRRVQDGEHRATVAADLGISRHTVDSIMTGRRGSASARNSGASKALTDNEVRQIRQSAAAGVAQRELAERFGTSQQVVSQIVRRVTYREVR